LLHEEVGEVHLDTPEMRDSDRRRASAASAPLAVTGGVGEAFREAMEDGRASSFTGAPLAPPS